MTTKLDSCCADIIRELRRKADNSNFLFGFMMDRPENGMGATGWDMIKGNCYPSKEEKGEE